MLLLNKVIYFLIKSYLFLKLCLFMLMIPMLFYTICLVPSWAIKGWMHVLSRENIEPLCFMIVWLIRLAGFSQITFIYLSLWRFQMQCACHSRLNVKSDLFWASHWLPSRLRYNYFVCVYLSHFDEPFSMF